MYETLKVIVFQIMFAKKRAYSYTFLCQSLHSHKLEFDSFIPFFHKAWIKSWTSEIPGKPSTQQAGKWFGETSATENAEDTG